MKKHIGNEDIDNGRMDDDAEAHAAWSRVDMREHGIFEWNLVIKEKTAFSSYEHA